MLTLISLVGVACALSAPDQALYFAQEMAWDGSGVLDYRKYPQRPIANAPHAFQFQQIGQGLPSRSRPAADERNPEQDTIE
jgi:hypothetical protein